MLHHISAPRFAIQPRLDAACLLVNFNSTPHLSLTASTCFFPYSFGLSGSGRDISFQQSLLRDTTHSYCVYLPHIGSRGHSVIRRSQPNPFP
jgi:hypothetical protein